MNFIVYCCRRFSLLQCCNCFLCGFSKLYRAAFSSLSICTVKIKTTKWMKKKKTYESIVIVCICAFPIMKFTLSVQIYCCMIQWQVHAELISFFFSRACARFRKHTLKRTRKPKSTKL